MKKIVALLILYVCFQTVNFPFTQLMPRPTCFPTCSLMLSFSMLFFHKLLSAFSYLMHILDLAPTLQKPQSRKPLITEVIPAVNILRKSLVQLYLPLSLPDEKAIWRIPAPSLSKVDMILLSLILGTQKLRRSPYFSPSPGRATMQRALGHLAQGSACCRAFLETEVLEVCARAYRFLLHREQCFSNLGGELFDFFLKKKPIQVCHSILVLSLPLQA